MNRYSWKSQLSQLSQLSYIIFCSDHSVLFFALHYCTFCTFPFQSANSAMLFFFFAILLLIHFFERLVQKLSVSCSYIFLVIVNHSRTYYVLGTDAKTDSNASPTRPKPYVHVRNGNEMVTEMKAK